MKVLESYKEYKPFVNVKRSILSLLSKFPEQYLKGLSSIVLTNYSGLSRTRRRDTSKYTLGLYHHKYQGKDPWIELFIDNIFKGRNKIFLKIPVYREYIIGQTLYHELSHHIHFNMKPSHDDPEFIAYKWEERFSREFLNKKYWFLVPLFLLGKPFKTLTKNIHFSLIILGVFFFLHFFYLYDFFNDLLNFYNAGFSSFFILQGLLLMIIDKMSKNGIDWILVHTHLIPGFILVVLGLTHYFFNFKLPWVVEISMVAILVIVGLFMDGKLDRAKTEGVKQ